MVMQACTPLLLRATERKNHPSPLPPVTQGGPAVKKINLDVALACSHGPCWAVGAAPSCTPNLKSELCAGGSRPQTRWGLRGLGLCRRPARLHPSGSQRLTPRLADSQDFCAE